MIPSGDAKVFFKGSLALCRIEVMMVAFTKGSCRVRGEFLEDHLRWRKGDKFGNHDTTLTEEILQIIRS